MSSEPTRTPSMDDKATPSPPIRTTKQYLLDCAAGIQRVGKPVDREDIEARR